MNLYITRQYGKNNQKNAGAKAPADINAICNCLGWEEVTFKFPEQNAGKWKRIYSFFLKCPMQWMRLRRLKGATVLYQHPMYFGTKVAMLAIPRLRKHCNMRFIILLHDLESLRSRAANVSQKYMDIALIQKADVVICHNKKMKEYLIEQGIKRERIVELGIFDYLSSKKILDKKFKADIAIAGNLSRQKCGYIYKLAENNPDIEISLYGVGLDDSMHNENMTYMGSYSPEELPQELDAKYGLVWDGPEISSCCGTFGEYLRYNDPHKFSLYMASGIPVITWSQAAIADFVKENNVGIVLDNLCDLKSVIDEITDETYMSMCKNAGIIGQKVRDGYYFKMALRKAMKLCDRQK